MAVGQPNVEEHPPKEGCPVALAYCFACQAANLRDRLKAIEDILGEEYDLDQLREVKSKINEPQDDGWISVENPPKKEGQYEVVQTRLNGTKTRVTIALYDPRYYDVDGWEHTGVTHWRPLPEQPKEEQK